jgi:hypothetical protein
VGDGGRLSSWLKDAQAEQDLLLAQGSVTADEVVASLPTPEVC